MLYLGILLFIWLLGGALSYGAMNSYAIKKFHTESSDRALVVAIAMLGWLGMVLAYMFGWRFWTHGFKFR